jgi:hypothetical protein
MLIFNDEHRRRSGIRSLSKRCPYCSKALAAYPLILSADAGLFVYHAACAAALATEILVDLYTFFRPPAPYHQLFVLDPRHSANAHEKAGTSAVNGSCRDQSRHLRASVSSVYTGEVGSIAG